MNVIIPTSLRKHTGGASKVAVNGNLVADALRELVMQHPELKTHLYDDNGNLVTYVNVFVNNDNIRDLDAESTALTERDEIVLVPAIAGG